MCFDDPMAAFETNQWPVVLLPQPLGLPEIRRAQSKRPALLKLELATAGPAWMEEGDVGVGIWESNCHGRLTRLRLGVHSKATNGDLPAGIVGKPYSRRVRIKSPLDEPCLNTSPY